MSFLCILKHNFQPIKVFQTQIVSSLSVPNAKNYGYDASWTGFVCKRCNKRKIVKGKGVYQSVGATQNAYDWLNEKSKRNKLLKELQNE